VVRVSKSMIRSFLASCVHCNHTAAQLTKNGPGRHSTAQVSPNASSSTPTLGVMHVLTTLCHLHLTKPGMACVCVCTQDLQ
jgi:hypothetical protein